jgi:hypothetical protein
MSSQRANGVPAFGLRDSQRVPADVAVTTELRRWHIRVPRSDPAVGDPADGAKIAVELALIGDDGPSGEFINDSGARYPW